MLLSIQIIGTPSSMCQNILPSLPVSKLFFTLSSQVFSRMSLGINN